MLYSYLDSRAGGGPGGGGGGGGDGATASQSVQTTVRQCMEDGPVAVRHKTRDFGQAF